MTLVNAFLLALAIGTVACAAADTIYCKGGTQERDLSASFGCDGYKGGSNTTFAVPAPPQTRDAYFSFSNAVLRDQDCVRITFGNTTTLCGDDVPIVGAPVFVPSNGAGAIKVEFLAGPVDQTPGVGGFVMVAGASLGVVTDNGGAAFFQDWPGFAYFVIGNHLDGRLVSAALDSFSNATDKAFPELYLGEGGQLPTEAAHLLRNGSVAPGGGSAGESVSSLALKDPANPPYVIGVRVPDSRGVSVNLSPVWLYTADTPVAANARMSSANATTLKLSATKPTPVLVQLPENLFTDNRIISSRCSPARAASPGSACTPACAPATRASRATSTTWPTSSSCRRPSPRTARTRTPSSARRSARSATFPTTGPSATSTSSPFRRPKTTRTWRCASRGPSTDRLHSASTLHSLSLEQRLLP